MSGCCVVEPISGEKISPVSRSKRKTQSFPHLRRSLDTRGLRVWREEGRLIAFVPSGTSLMKGAVAAQFSFLTLDQKSSKHFCKHPKINTFLGRAKLCKRSRHVEECKFVHKGSMRCQSQSFPTVANYLESVSCLWSLEGRNEVRRHSFQISPLFLVFLPHPEPL